jgi:hypothetical protein
LTCRNGKKLLAMVFWSGGVACRGTAKRFNSQKSWKIFGCFAIFSAVGKPIAIIPERINAYQPRFHQFWHRAAKHLFRRRRPTQPLKSAWQPYS